MDEEKRWIQKVVRYSDREAANRLLERHYAQVYAYVYRQTLDRETALDLTQDIFVAALRSLWSFRGKESSFRSWVFGIATNKIIDHFRSRKKRWERESISRDDPDFQEECVPPALDEKEADFTLAVETREEAGHAAVLLEALAPGEQQVLRLKLFGEYTFGEIAQMLGIPESTIKTRYYSAIRKLRKKLVKEEPARAKK